MPAISIKGTTGTVKSRRDGANIIVEKTIEKGVITETHKGTGKRIRGKQAAVITLSAEDAKGFENATAEVLQDAYRGMNVMTNKFGATLEAKHTATMKKMTQRVKTMNSKLTAAKEATKAAVTAKAKFVADVEKGLKEKAEKKEKRDKEREEEKEKEKEKKKREKSAERAKRDKSVARPTEAKRDKSVARPTEAKRDKSVARPRDKSVARPRDKSVARERRARQAPPGEPKMRWIREVLCVFILGFTR